MRMDEGISSAKPKCSFTFTRRRVLSVLILIGDHQDVSPAGVQARSTSNQHARFEAVWSLDPSKIKITSQPVIAILLHGSWNAT